MQVLSVVGETELSAGVTKHTGINTAIRSSQPAIAHEAPSVKSKVCKITISLTPSYLVHPPIYVWVDRKLLPLQCL